VETKISYLLDTCILVDFLRGNKSIYDILVNNKNVDLSISTITMMELMLGAFNNKSHNLLIDDALIAATSLVTKLELMTYNKADFQYIPNIKLYKS